MIYYFSGTGNARWVANELSRFLDCKVCSVGEALCANAEIDPFEFSDTLILVFPVHSWGPAISMLDFIAKWHIGTTSEYRIFAVCVCGDDCGRTDKILRKTLAHRGLHLSAIYSVTMPNNYILLPGFDVDVKEIRQSKLKKALERVKNIADAIMTNSLRSLYHAGRFPALKSAIYPLFRKYAQHTNSFYATEDCVQCGKCVDLCPAHIISLSSVNGRPQWDSEGCTQCVACIHRCPQQAIQFGKITYRKGRYTHPDWQ